jgi:hypothetical protein
MGAVQKNQSTSLENLTPTFFVSFYELIAHR